jgi:hypothetical protein
MSSELDPVYSHYWECKRLRAEVLPVFPVTRWWDDPGLCEVERIYFDAVKDAPSLLDVGAGDLRIRRKFLAAANSRMTTKTWMMSVALTRQSFAST